MAEKAGQQECEASGHTVKSGRDGGGAGNAGAPLTFSFLLSLGPSPWDSAEHIQVDLPSLVKASWKHPCRHIQRGFHDDSKSYHFD